MSGECATAVWVCADERDENEAGELEETGSSRSGASLRRTSCWATSQKRWSVRSSLRPRYRLSNFP